MSAFTPEEIQRIREDLLISIGYYLTFEFRVDQSLERSLAALKRKERKNSISAWFLGTVKIELSPLNEGTYEFDISKALPRAFSLKAHGYLRRVSEDSTLVTGIVTNRNALVIFFAVLVLPMEFVVVLSSHLAAYWPLMVVIASLQVILAIAILASQNRNFVSFVKRSMQHTQRQ